MNFNIKTAAWPFIGTLALTIAVPFNLNAQNTEEIVVTARKREESLQEVPISITAFSADQLQSMGLSNNNDVATMTVNFNTMQQLGRRLDRPVIRGMAAPETFGEPNASYFIDGAYLSGSISAYTLGPIEQVEILRGPQSAQFGRATFSGAVNYVTRKPTNDFEGETTFRVGENDTSTYAGWVSGPLIQDKLLGFISASQQEYGGEWNNELETNEASRPLAFVDPPQYADSSKLGGTQTKQIEGKLLWIINDTAEVTFKAGYVNGDDDHYPQLMVPTNNQNCYRAGIDIAPGSPNYSTSPGAICGVIDPDGLRNALNLPDFREGMVANLSLTAPNPPFTPTKEPEDYISPPREPGSERDQYNYLISYVQDISDWTATTRLTYNKSELVTAYDLDGTPSRALTGQFGFYEEDERKDYSFESRLDSPGDNSFRGSVGVYYYHLKRDSSNAASPGITGQGQLSQPVRTETDNYALFGALDWDLTDNWSATAEARWARDEKYVKSVNKCTPESNGFLQPSFYDPKYDGKTLEDTEAKNALTPRFTVRYQITDAAMVYVQAAKGNKPGDYNVNYFRGGRDACFAFDALENGGNVYVEEEKQWTYEVGTKTSWLDNRITANLAAFYIDWENQTFFETTPVQGEVQAIPSSIGFNAGESRIYGLELETTFAVTDNLLATFAYGFTDGEFKDGYSCNFAETTGIGLVPNGTGGFTCGDPDTTNNLEGNTIPNSPRHNFVTSLAYNAFVDTDFGQFGFFARTDYSYEDGRYSAVNNFAEMGKRQIWNARTGLEQDRWTATVFVNNILDDDTPSAIIAFPRFDDPNPAPGNSQPLQGYALSAVPGRTYGGELIFRFGARAE
ncbi:MAG: TonB-dependent receptor [Gammaproteobacteria bacterium]